MSEQEVKGRRKPATRAYTDFILFHKHAVFSSHDCIEEKKVKKINNQSLTC